MPTDPEIDALSTQVDSTVGVEASAVTLLSGISTLVANAAGDRAASLALAAKLKASSDALAAAVASNQPPAPTPAA